MKRLLFLILVLAFSLFCLWLTFRDVGMEELWTTIRSKSASWPAFLAAGFVMMLNIVFRGFRFHRILSSYPEVGGFRCCTITSVMFLGNSILPFRAGEAIRVYLPFRIYRIPIATSLVFHGADRIFDVLAMVIMLALGLFFAGDSILPEKRAEAVEFYGMRYTFDDIIGSVQQTSLFILAVALAGVFLVLFLPEPIKLVLRKAFSPLGDHWAGRMESVVDHMHHGVSIFKRPLDLALASFWTFMVWLMVIINVQILTAVFGQMLNWAQAGLVTVIVAVAVTLPQAPGYIGPFQLGFKMALLLFALPTRDALAIAWLAWFFQIFPVTFLGFISLFWEGLSFGTFTEAQEVVEAGQDSPPPGSRE